MPRCVRRVGRGDESCYHDNICDASSTIALLTAEGAENAETTQSRIKGEKEMRGDEEMVLRAFGAPRPIIFLSPFIPSSGFEMHRTSAFSALSAVSVSPHLDSAPPSPMQRDN